MQCPRVATQGQLGSCTANAPAGALEFLEFKQAQTPVDLSRLFDYCNERVVEHSVEHDSSAMLRDSIKTLAKQGVCAEKLWPAVVKQFAQRPTATCYAQAKRHTISSYQRLSTSAEMRACLAGGYPFVFGFTAYANFESTTVARTGVVNLPKKGESAIGGHAMCAVGYADATQTFIVRNSWGASWGQQGYCTMPYAYLADRNLSDDFWTMRKLAA